jgi:uncharacterized protein YcbX
MHVSGLYYYPIKSCRGFALDVAQLEPRGIQHDRRLMVTSATGVFLTQREHPQLALIEPAIDGDSLVLHAPAMPPLRIQCRDDGQRVPVKIWRDETTAIDQGALAADWLSAFLQVTCRLVRVAPDSIRPVSPHYAVNPGDQVGFADGFPLLLIAQESLDDLNTRLPAPIGMNRFRPNLVVSGCAPYAEDTWSRISIAGIIFDLVKPCARCAITTTDQATAERGKEPLRTLATSRTVGGKVMFGQNVLHNRAGRIRLGDAVEIVAAKFSA